MNRRLVLALASMVLTACASLAYVSGGLLARKQQRLIFTPNAGIACNAHSARCRRQDGSCLGGECDGEAPIRLPVAIDPEGRGVVAEG